MQSNAQCVLSVIVYGTATWSLAFYLIHKLKVVERAMGRAVVRVLLRDKTRNEVIFVEKPNSSTKQANH